MRSDDKHRLFEIVQGMVDALVVLPETCDAFDTWDAQLGIAGKARARDGQEAFERATTGQDYYDSRGLLWSQAQELLRRLGYRGPIDLSLHVLDRFIRAKAAEGGRPLAPTPAPDFAPKLRRRFVIPESWPAWYVRQHLPRFVAQVKAAIATAERRSGDGMGAPVNRDIAPLRRYGRWHFLCETGRATRESLAREIHQGRGPDHEKSHGVGVCASCLKNIERGLKKATELIEARGAWSFRPSRPPEGRPATK
jgi:hypothetical protein